MALKRKTDNQAGKQIERLRSSIDALDDIIIRVVARRMAVSRIIGDVKKNHSLKIKDPKREKQLVTFHAKLAKKYGLTQETVRKIFDLIMKESKRIQK